MTESPHWHVLDSVHHCRLELAIVLMSGRTVAQRPVHNYTDVAVKPSNQLTLTKPKIQGNTVRMYALPSPPVHSQKLLGILARHVYAVWTTSMHLQA